MIDKCSCRYVEEDLDSLCAHLSDERILAAREKKEQNKRNQEAEAIGPKEQKASKTSALDSPRYEGEPTQERPKEKRKSGRPPGSKNKKTLEREAELVRLEAEGKAPEKRKREGHLVPKTRRLLREKQKLQSR